MKIAGIVYFKLVGLADLLDNNAAKIGATVKPMGHR